MNAVTKTLAICVAAGFSLWATAAEAAIDCTNDVDCADTGGNVCGGKVCKWSTDGLSHTCVAAGTDAKGADGWCTADTDCKCNAQGATCAGIQCTFTQPTGVAGAAGAAGTGGTGGAGGAVGTGGTSPGTGGSAGTGSGSSDDGGCSVGRVPASGSAGSLVALVACAGVALRRRRGR